jgi:quercetin dioxygenase-like cupin family protein
MRLLVLLVAATLVGSPVAAHAQDALATAPAVYKKVLENERMRVLEGTFKPGAKTGRHSHPEHLLYILTDGALVFRQEGKTPYEMTFKKGEAYSLAAQTLVAENDSDKEVRVLVVELKQPARAASQPARGKRTAAKGKGKSKGAAAGKRKHRR